MFLQLFFAMLLSLSSPTSPSPTEEPETPPAIVVPIDPPGGDIGNNPPR